MMGRPPPRLSQCHAQVHGPNVSGISDQACIWGLFVPNLLLATRADVRQLAGFHLRPDVGR